MATPPNESLLQSPRSLDLRDKSSSRWSGSFVCSTIALCACYVLLGSEWDRPTRADSLYNVEATELQQRSESGSNWYRAAFLGIGVVGAVLLSAGWNTGPVQVRGVCLSIVLVLLWCLLSIAWSEEPALTLRRLVSLACVSLAALGFARCFRALQIAQLGFCFCLLMLGVGLASEWAHGTLDVTNVEFRFAGTYHPNQQAIHSVVLFLSSVVLAREYRRLRFLFHGVALVAFAALLLTKSRGSLAGLFLALATIWALTNSPKVKYGSLGIAFILLCLVVFGLVLAEKDDVQSLRQLALMGRDEQHESLTGRLPIWAFAWERIAERPWLGAGYNTFWTEESLAAAHADLEWAVPDAHNAYLEIALHVGLIGLILIVVCVLMGLRHFCDSRLRAADRGYTFLIGLTVFGLANAWLESHMSQTFNFTPFLVACGLARVALFETIE